MALGKGPSALQRPLPSPGYRIRHVGDQAACKERESSESASVQVRDAGVGRMLGCESCCLSVQFIPVSSAGSWRASMLGPLSEERGVQRAEQQGGCSQGAPAGNWRFARVLDAVGDLSGAGGQVKVVVCVATVQVLGWWKL